MVTHNNFYFIKNATKAQESPMTVNTQGDILTLQVEGTATSLSLQVFGISDMASDEWHLLTGFTTNYDLIKKVCNDLDIECITNKELFISKVKEG